MVRCHILLVEGRFDKFLLCQGLNSIQFLMLLENHESFYSSLPPAMSKYLGRLGSLAKVGKPVLEKDTYEFKPDLLRIKLTLCYTLPEDERNTIIKRVTLVHLA